MNRKEYLLVCLAEEACEVGQAATKCLRFTPEHTYGGYLDSNLERLDVELNQLITIVKMLEKELGHTFKMQHEDKKEHATENYIKISTEMGVINDL